MMEHFRLHDWCSSQPECHFVQEQDLDNCVTERILRNKFFDPLLDDNESDSDTPLKIDWDELFKKCPENDNRLGRKFVPGLRAFLPYPKVSALTSQQHYQCLKVLCSEETHVLKSEFIPRPTKQDYRVFEEVQTLYKQEQKEYLEWAKSLWSQHCIRALHPKPPIEEVYDAQIKMKTQMLKSFPKTYDLAAQIPLESKSGNFDMVFQKELIGVEKSALPQIEYPETIDEKINIIKSIPVPKPCNKHPCPFVLPNEHSVTFLPLSVIHNELAMYALDNGAQCVASENALKCLVELDKHWCLPLSVCPVLSPDGDTTNIVILGSEFPNKREDAQTRTYKALRHLLEVSLIPASQQHKVSSRANLSSNTTAASTKELNNSNSNNNMDVPSDDDDEDNLFIVDIFEQSENSQSDTEMLDRDEGTDKMDIDTNQVPKEHNTSPNKQHSKNNGKDIGIFTCTCKDSMFEKPPPRSFKKWQLRNPSMDDNYNIIVHCAHRVKNKIAEVILEPIPEYQIDVGGSRMSKHKIKSLALSLLLRQNASLLNVRVECPSGDIVRIDSVHGEQFSQQHGHLVPDIANTLHTALNQLQGLLPGDYMLQHEANHGSNALLMSPSGETRGAVGLQCGGDGGTEGDAEAAALAAPPALEPVLLPLHKFRKILPCAFTPFPKQVARETKKPPAKRKTPPQAISWPKKRSKKKKGNNRR